MIRFKNFNATGVAPDGRLYAGDLNQLQDLVAALSDFTQTHDVGTLRVGDSSIQLLKFGAAEGRITAALRVDGILRGLGGVVPPTMSTAVRDALTEAQRPYGILIVNTTTNRLEQNVGTAAVPVWIGVGAVEDNTISTAKIQDNAVIQSKMADNSVGADEIVAGAVGNTELADNAVTLTKMADASVGTAEIVDLSVTNGKVAAGAIDAGKISGTLKPSGTAVDATEALRALGTAAGMAAKGTHAAQHALAGADPLPADSVGGAQISALAITDAKIAAANKDGAVGTPSMRTLGAGAQQAAAGNDARFSDARIPHPDWRPVLSVVAGSFTGNYTITAPAAGTYILEWGAGQSSVDSQGDGGQISNNKTGGLAVFSDVGPSGGTAAKTVVLGAGEVVTLTASGTAGWSVYDPWAKLTRIA